MPDEFSPYCQVILGTIGTSNFGTLLRPFSSPDNDAEDQASYIQKEREYQNRPVDPMDLTLGHPTCELPTILQELDAHGLILVKHVYAKDAMSYLVTDWYSPIKVVLPDPPYRLSWEEIVYLSARFHAEVRTTERGRMAINRTMTWFRRDGRPPGLGMTSDTEESSIVSPNQIQPEAFAANAELSNESLALAVLTEHPDWSVKEIANVVGVHRSTLYTYPKFTKAREILKANAPHRSDRRRGRTGKPIPDTSHDTKTDSLGD